MTQLNEATIEASEVMTREALNTARANIVREISRAEIEVNQLALKAAMSPQFDKPLSEAREAIQRGQDKLNALKLEEVALEERERQADIERLADQAREDFISAIVVLHERMPAIAELDRALAAAKEACDAVNGLSAEVVALTSAHLARLDPKVAKSWSKRTVSGWNSDACLRPYDTDAVGSWIALVGSIPTNFTAAYDGCPEKALASLKRRLPEIVDEDFEREVERRSKAGV